MSNSTFAVANFPKTLAMFSNIIFGWIIFTLQAMFVKKLPIVNIHELEGKQY